MMGIDEIFVSDRAFADPDTAARSLQHQTHNPIDDPADGREPAERDRHRQHSPGNLDQCWPIAHQNYLRGANVRRDFQLALERLMFFVGRRALAPLAQYGM